MIGIYKITNPKGKIYIGQSINFERRFKEYNTEKCKNQPKLYNSLKKYGYNNHSFEIIEECDINHLNERERYYQDLYDVLSKGLNCKLTNTFDKSGKLSDSIKQKLSEMNSGNKHPQYGKFRSEEIIEKIRAANIGSNNPMYGKKGILHPNSKKVINIETNEIYDSLNECCEINNLNSKYMSRYLNGSRPNKTIYKYYEEN